MEGHQVQVSIRVCGALHAQLWIPLPLTLLLLPLQPPAPLGVPPGSRFILFY